MKKYFFTLAAMLIGATAFTSCNDDDDNNNRQNRTPFCNGAYVVCSGNMSNSIGGSLTYIDYTTGSSTVKAFANANGRELGLTPNHAIAYGNKLYIVVSDENTIEVVDKNTLKSIKQLKTNELLGEKGNVPRRLAAADGNIYLTTYGTSTADWSTNTTSGKGCVAVIDTLKFSVQKTFEVGPYPEGISYYSGAVAVAISNYGMGGGYVSAINLTSGMITDFKYQQLNNPYDVLLGQSIICVLDYGSYDENWKQVNAGVYVINSNDQCSKLIDATAMTTDGYNIYSYNAPFGGSAITYNITNPTTGVTTRFQPEGITHPAAIGVDPIYGYILIASYNKNADTGYPDYNSNAYVNVYDGNGLAVKKDIPCGVSPCFIDFNYGIKIQ